MIIQENHAAIKANSIIAYLYLICYNQNMKKSQALEIRRGIFKILLGVLLGTISIVSIFISIFKQDTSPYNLGIASNTIYVATGYIFRATIFFISLLLIIRGTRDIHKCRRQLPIQASDSPREIYQTTTTKPTMSIEAPLADDTEATLSSQTKKSRPHQPPKRCQNPRNRPTHNL